MSTLEWSTALEEALKLRAANRGAVIVAVVNNTSVLPLRAGARMVIPDDGPPLGNFSTALDPLLLEHGRDFLARKRSGARDYLVTNDRISPVRVNQGNLTVYFESLSLPPRLIVVGAGHIALPLVDIAKRADFEVFVLDDRAEYASPERFPTADRMFCGPYPDTLSAIEIHDDTFIVLVTRGHVHDQACLEVVADSAARYIGIIGSKRRVRTVLERALLKNLSPEKSARIFAPIGLDIGAETPAEIAVAIMAEIVMVRRGASGTSLSVRRNAHA